MRLELVGQHRQPVLDGFGLGHQRVVLAVEHLELILVKRLVLHQLFELAAPRLDRFQARGLLVGQFGRIEHDAVEILRVVIGIAARDRPDPGEPGLLADALGLGFHHLGSDALGDLGIDPAVAALAEEVAIDPATGGRIAVLADQEGDRFVGF